MKPEQGAACELEARIGHPGEKWEGLKERVQANAVQQFVNIEVDWLDLMWTLDQYRIAGVPPRAMGKETTAPGRRLEAIYRGKGNWFAELLALLLQNRTAQRIGPRQRVQGFSQLHQIDLAWPPRSENPLVCVETKVTGAPAVGTTPARASTADFSNRRKELKFAATDLKLYLRQQATAIEHWGAWRAQAPPRTYFLWAARLRPDVDRLPRLVAEARALVDTYLDGAGLIAWQENESRTAYDVLTLPQSERVSDLDDVLHRIATEINLRAGADQTPPPPELPTERAIAPDELPLEEV